MLLWGEQLNDSSLIIFSPLSRESWRHWKMLTTLEISKLSSVLVSTSNLTKMILVLDHLTSHVWRASYIVMRGVFNSRNIKTTGIPVNPRGGVSRGKWDGDELRRVKQERQVWVLNRKINDYVMLSVNIYPRWLFIRGVEEIHACLLPSKHVT